MTAATGTQLNFVKARMSAMIPAPPEGIETGDRLELRTGAVLFVGHELWLRSTPWSAAAWRRFGINPFKIAPRITTQAAPGRAPQGVDANLKVHLPFLRISSRSISRCRVAEKSYRCDAGRPACMHSMACSRDSPNRNDGNRGSALVLLANSARQAEDRTDLGTRSKRTRPQVATASRAC